MSQRPISLAVCIPVWNRGDLLRACFDSLCDALTGVDATIYLFDNGSDAETVEVVQKLRSTGPRLVKTFFQQNLGIPYAVNCFSRMINEPCEVEGLVPPRFVMIMDADAYFKRPLEPFLRILGAAPGVGVLGGHDSIEHQALAFYELHADGDVFRLKAKASERMTCMIMRREELDLFHPFPTSSYQDVDWQITLCNRSSLSARKRQLLVADIVAHLGQFDSTWNPGMTPADRAELDEIASLLDEHGLWTPAREQAAHRQRMYLTREESQACPTNLERGWAKELERIHREHFPSPA